MVRKIFISYRREDDPGFTHALRERLESELPANDLFMDADIEAGHDFVAVLNRAVAACDVLLAVIGPRWSELLAARGGDLDDFVVIEIKAALDQGKRVIPVLVGAAAMPRADTLPVSIRALARLQAVILRPDRFRNDCHSLVTALKEHLASVERAPAARAEAERTAAEAKQRRRGSIGKIGSMGPILLGAIITGLIALLFAYVGKHYFGLPSFSWATISIDAPKKKSPEVEDQERRAVEAQKRHEEQLAAAKRQEERARAEAEATKRKLEAARVAAELEATQRHMREAAEAEANKRRLESERAAQELEAAQRRRREAAEAERLARARRIQEWRDANGGCDPPLRKQCMTIGSSGGGPRQVLGCTCVN